jgi:hypothetical protein
VIGRPPRPPEPPRSRLHGAQAATRLDGSSVPFRLPPGYRPADNKVHVELSIVQGAADGAGQVFVTGHEGAVAAPNVTGAFWLDGIHFRAVN